MCIIQHCLGIRHDLVEAVEQGKMSIELALKIVYLECT